MLDAPKQDWAFHESLTRKCDQQRLQNLTPGERFEIYEDLYRLIADGRRGLDVSVRFEAWRWQQKLAIRQNLVVAFQNLDQFHRERAAPHDAR